MFYQPRTIILPHLPQPFSSIFSNVTFIDFTYSFNEPVVNLPSTIHTLIFAQDFDQALDNLPEGLRELRIVSPGFNQPLEFLPSTLVHLNIYGDFNHPVDHLPAGLTELGLLGSFNQIIDHLPSQLLSLHLGDDFNQPVGHLPSNLRNLRIGSYNSSFDFPLDKLPPTLQSLRLIGYHHKRPLNCLPSSLESFTLSSFGLYQLDLSDIRTIKSLKSLKIKDIQIVSGLDSLPNSLQSLSLWETAIGCNINSLPPNLQHLALGYINEPVVVLPISLRTFVVQAHTPVLLHSLPHTLTNLVFSYDFNEVVDALPSSITHLTFGFRFTQPLNKLPPNLLQLRMGPCFNHQLTAIPRTLQLLSLFEHRAGTMYVLNAMLSLHMFKIVFRLSHGFNTESTLLILYTIDNSNSNDVAGTVEISSIPLSVTSISRENWENDRHTRCSEVLEDMAYTLEDFSTFSIAGWSTQYLRLRKSDCCCEGHVLSCYK